MQIEPPASEEEQDSLVLLVGGSGSSSTFEPRLEQEEAAMEQQVQEAQDDDVSMGLDGTVGTTTSTMMGDQEVAPLPRSAARPILTGSNRTNRYHPDPIPTTTNPIRRIGHENPLEDKNGEQPMVWSSSSVDPQPPFAFSLSPPLSDPQHDILAAHSHTSQRSDRSGSTSALSISAGSPTPPLAPTMTSTSYPYHHRLSS